MTQKDWADFMDYCSVAQSVVLVAPYIKYKALEMTLDKVHPSADLSCVTRWTPLDVSLGASDISCRSQVIGKNGKFRIHSDLHAKYYRADDVILIGSSNLTLSGLGFTDSPNLEILTWVERSPYWDTFEDRVMRESRDVTDSEFAMWGEITATSVDLPDIGFPILDLSRWMPQTRDPSYLWLAYSGGSVPSREQYKLAMDDLHALRVPSGLDRQSFDEWLYATLPFSPFVNFVLRQRRVVQSDVVLWDLICEEWDVDGRGVAARFTETVYNWARRYGLLV